MRDDFAAFILTHGRPNKVYTAETLKKGGYTGKVYIIIDDEDDTADAYRKQFGDKVIQFSKEEISHTFDTGDLSKERRTIVYARNACFKIAKELGLKYFLELDDDYTSFEYRSVNGFKLMVNKCKQLDRLFEGMIRFLDDTNAVTVALSQGGDFIGGAQSKRYREKVTRKAMNTFFCRTDKPFDFVGRINEDVNTYTTMGMRGELIMSITEASIVQKQTQSNSGGMTEAYLDMGTYLKSFFTVMYCPSCVKVGAMGDKHMRMHHHIDWRRCVPKILNEKHKKK